MQVRPHYLAAAVVGVCLISNFPAAAWPGAAAAPANRGRSSFHFSSEDQSRARAFSEFAWGLLLEMEDQAPREKIEAHYLKALRAMPGSHLLFRQIVLPWLEQEDYQRLADALTPIARDNPRVIHLQITAATALQALDRLPEAADLLDHAYHQHDPRSPQLLRELIAVLWRQKRYSDLNHRLARARTRPEFKNRFLPAYATAIFFGSLADHPESTDFSPAQTKRFRRRSLRHAKQAANRLDQEVLFSDWQRLFELLKQAKAWPEAARALDRAAAAFPEHSLELGFQKTLVLLRQDHNQKALGVLADLEEELPLAFEPRARAGQMYLEAGKFDRARQFLEQAFDLRPGNLRVRLLLAYASHFEGDHRQAYELLDQIEATAPPILLLRSQAALGMNQPEQARELADQARQLAEQTQDEEFVSVEFLLYQATVHDQLNQPEEMLQLAEQAYAKKPDDPIVQNFLGYTLADQNLQLERAEKLIVLAVEAKPKNMAVRDSLAWVYYRQRRTDEALREINRTLQLALREAESDGVVFSHAGDIYAAAGYPRLAVYYWQLAILFDSRDADALAEKIAGAREAPDRVSSCDRRQTGPGDQPE